ncbi:MAG TPA: tetratricopeptide repeat protein [Holophagaceae bacterium]|nr:tetratricopeptide repeat protein [Holophagaceae bacterium]
MLGVLRQQQAEGELILEQYDGTRRLYFSGGNLRYLRSDASGEQFGNYLLRLGVLDYQALQELLANKSRVGERVVHWGLMSEQERDGRLHELFASILLHALEHPVLKTSWVPQSLDQSLGPDLQFPLDHRFIIWKVFEEISSLPEMAEQLEQETRWKWRASNDLLESMSDLPLTPQLAYALTVLSPEPMGYETLLSVTGLDEAECARLVLVCWTLGGLELVEGPSPLQSRPGPEAQEATPATPPAAEAEPEPTMEAVPEPPPPPAPVPEMDPMDIALDLQPSQPAAPPPPPSTPVPPSIPPEKKARHMFHQAESLELQGRPSEAIRMLEEAIKLDGESPRSFESWMLLGRLRLSNPAWSSRAIDALKTAAHVRPDAADPWLLMGELYHRKGFLANARGCYRKALDIDPSVLLPTDLPLEDEGLEHGHKEGEGLLGRIKGLIKGER